MEKSPKLQLSSYRMSEKYFIPVLSEGNELVQQTQSHRPLYSQIFSPQGHIFGQHLFYEGQFGVLVIAHEHADGKDWDWTTIFWLEDDSSIPLVYLQLKKPSYFSNWTRWNKKRGLLKWLSSCEWVCSELVQWGSSSWLTQIGCCDQDWTRNLSVTGQVDLISSASWHWTSSFSWGELTSSRLQGNIDGLTGQKDHSCCTFWRELLQAHKPEGSGLVWRYVGEAPSSANGAWMTPEQLVIFLTTEETRAEVENNDLLREITRTKLPRPPNDFADLKKCKRKQDPGRMSHQKPQDYKHVGSLNAIWQQGKGLC